MKFLKQAFVLPLLLSVGVFSGVSYAKVNKKAAAPSKKSELNSELDSLREGGFGHTPREKMYVIQSRHVDLTKKWQVFVGTGKDMNSNIYLDTRETSFAVKYHFNNRVYAQIDAAKLRNELTYSGKRIWVNEGIYPDTSFVERRYGGSVGFNLLYGKIRVTQDLLVYFDQFISLGAAMIEQSAGDHKSTVPGFTAEAGFSISAGRHLSLHVGARNTYFEEKRVASSGNVNQMMAYAGVGYLLGGEVL